MTFHDFELTEQQRKALAGLLGGREAPQGIHPARWRAYQSGDIPVISWSDLSDLCDAFGAGLVIDTLTLDPTAVLS